MVRLIAAVALLSLGPNAWAQYGGRHGYHGHGYHGHHHHGHDHHHGGGGFGFYFNPYYFGGYGYGPHGGYRHGGYYDGGFFGNDYRLNEPRSVTVLLPTNIVNLEVRLPDAESECWFGGVKQRGQGTVRRFQTPELEPGISYTYTVSAAWHKNGHFVTEERRVSVQANSFVVVDFTKPLALPVKPEAIEEIPPPAEPPPVK
jgi:uncharacterized protein (TIGR03000 family)